MSYVVKHLTRGEYLTHIVDVDSGRISDYVEPDQKLAIRFGKKEAANEVCEALARHCRVPFTVVRIRRAALPIGESKTDG